MITTILFDVDGVLIDSYAANFEFYTRLFTKAGYQPPTAKAYVNYFQLTMMDVIKEVTKSTDEKEIQRIMTIGKNRSEIYPFNLITVPHDLIPIIQELRKTYTLGIVTSRIKGGVFTIPQLQPIQHYFSTVVTFDDTENHKPHPDPILFAMKQLNVTPEETVYIGDQQADFLAAKEAGTNIIMISQHPYPQATACIKSFSDIPKTIASLG